MTLVYLLRIDDWFYLPTYRGGGGGGGGWSAKVLDSLSVPVRPTNLDNRSTALAVGAVFFSFFFFFFF